jgi:TolB-like protein/Tfp pilus assembly protein PilF
MYANEYGHWDNAAPDSLDRSLRAARTAVEAAPLHSLPYYALAQALFFKREIPAFRVAAERAVSLNPMDGATAAFMGLLIAYAGDWERGCALSDQGSQLNPNHPGWYRYTAWHDAYRQKDYRKALDVALHLNAPKNYYTHAVLAICYAQLGRMEEARKALRDMLALKPNYAEVARELHGRWIEPDLVEQLMDGLRKAGLELPDDPTKPGPSPATTTSGATHADEGFWVAVLPFKYSGGDATLAAFADGMTDEIVTGLSRFSYLRVLSRGSTLRDAGNGADARTVGKGLGARYALEGNVRQAGSTLRVSVQLIEAESGAHLWAETYSRPFRSDRVFELQDDLVSRIVATVGDPHGILPHTMSELLRSKAPGELTPYEAVLRSFGFGYRSTAEEHAVVRDVLEKAVRDAPRGADAWAMLSLIYTHEYAHEFNVRPDPLGRALDAARRAAALAPSSAVAFDALAWVLFFRKEYAAFRAAAEQALAFNPLSSPTLAGLGTLTAYSGEWEKGCALVEQAVHLNPRHPGWYRFALFANAYRQRDYRGAVEIALKLNLPDFFVTHEVLAAAYGQLGERDAAAKALKELLRLRPDYAETGREKLEKWLGPEQVEHWMAGLRKAGLEIPDDPGKPGPSPAALTSGPTRADEGFWVAVLPFKYGGADSSLTALAEGLTEDIVTGLSRFSYLRVIARGSTLRYADQATDPRVVGKELGARYVMEGSLRQAGAKLRLAVQLVDAVSGAHLWAENYERSFNPEAVFELQDELVPRIVSTVADMHGVLPRSMSEAVRGRAPEELSPYEAVVRSFGYFDRVTAEELAAARSGLELAVQQAPAHADAWAMLALLCVQEYAQGFHLQADSLTSGETAARRAVEAAPSNHLAHFSLAQALFFQKEFQSFRITAERALALNPSDGNSIALLGELLTYAGDWKRGLELAERAKHLNPHHPGWYWYADFYNSYRQGDYRGALSFALKANLPGHWGMHLALAAAYGQLGERDAAGKALRDLLKLRPDFAATARSDIEKWWEPEYVERMIDGWRKAGLDVDAPARAAPAAERDAAIGIAVLPFSDMSPTRDQEYLCEGMAEEIMNALVRIEGIRVASRTSAFRARQDGSDLPAIARALSVNHVLEGSVRTAGGRLRVTAQLTDVTSGYQLWSERFDRDAADVFAVQDEIAAGVVEAVKARLGPGAPTIHARPRARNLDAYRSYLKGRHLRYAKEDYGGAIRAFEEAIRLDPTHAPSWTGLAESTAGAANLGAIPAREACAAARKALATAVELEGESADSLHAEAFVALIERRWPAMEAAWRRAIELQPTHTLALGSFGISLCIRQKADEGFRLLERAREADPLASFPLMLTGWALLCSGKPQEAERYAQDALSFEKEDASALLCSSMAKVALGQFEEGIATAEHLVAVSQRAASFLGVLGWALAAAGRKGEARAILQELRSLPAAPHFVSEGWLLGALGEIDAAFEALARAEEEYQAMLYYTGLPGFDSLRADPRFGALMERLGIP